MNTDFSAPKVPRSIWAVGRNYGAHAKELGNSIPSTPLIFLKSGACAVSSSRIELPSHSNDIHHEIEIALRFDRDLNFDAAALALDLTARDLQNQLKSEGHPWTIAKSFRQSCPISTWVPIPLETPHFQFELSVNGTQRQVGSTNDMIFSFAALRQFILERLPVEEGDVLLTGTPQGVARIEAGDRLSAKAASTSGHRLFAEWLIAPLA